MISGIRRLALVAALLLPEAAAAAPIDQMMDGMRAVRSARASFVEEKSLASLTEPLVSRGRLVYVAPSRLERHTDTPTKESLVVDGDVLVYSRPDENMTRSFDLASAPELRALTEAFRATLAGDLTTLRALFSVGFEGDEAHWRLTLVPRDEAARRLVKVVELTGEKAAVTEVLTTETGGDSTRMTVAYDP
ncbi:MAG: outer membrane lipoprotein carrier protein LolA [Geminicoccaceae bacterium]